MMAPIAAMLSVADHPAHATQCFSYMVAFGARAMFLTCATYTWALRHSEEDPGVLYVSEVRFPHGSVARAACEMIRRNSVHTNHVENRAPPSCLSITFMMSCTTTISGVISGSQQGDGQRKAIVGAGTAWLRHKTILHVGA